MTYRPYVNDLILAARVCLELQRAKRAYSDASGVILLLIVDLLLIFRNYFVLDM